MATFNIKKKFNSDSLYAFNLCLILFVFLNNKICFKALSLFVFWETGIMKLISSCFVPNSFKSHILIHYVYILILPVLWLFFVYIYVWYSFICVFKFNPLTILFMEYYPLEASVAVIWCFYIRRLHKKFKRTIVFKYKKVYIYIYK